MSNICRCRWFLQMSTRYGRHLYTSLEALIRLIIPVLIFRYSRSKLCLLVKFKTNYFQLAEGMLFGTRTGLDAVHWKNIVMNSYIMMLTAHTLGALLGACCPGATPCSVNTVGCTIHTRVRVCMRANDCQCRTINFFLLPDW